VHIQAILNADSGCTPIPEMLSDNGTEFTSRAMFYWAHERGVQLHFIEPGNPARNAFNESFNGRLRD